MRLWSTLHRLSRSNKSSRRADGLCARLTVEALDQRLLPSSFQWGVGQTLTLPSYELSTHKAGTLVSSYQTSSTSDIVITKTVAAAVNRHVQPLAFAKKTIGPTESISINFARPLMSFSWGEVNSPH